MRMFSDICSAVVLVAAMAIQAFVFSPALGQSDEELLNQLKDFTQGPPGDYKKACKNCKVDCGVLNCDCENQFTGERASTSFELRGCQEGSIQWASTMLVCDRDWEQIVIEMQKNGNLACFRDGSVPIHCSFGCARSGGGQCVAWDDRSEYAAAVYVLDAISPEQTSCTIASKKRGRHRNMGHSTGSGDGGGSGKRMRV